MERTKEGSAAAKRFSTYREVLHDLIENDGGSTSVETFAKRVSDKLGKPVREETVKRDLGHLRAFFKQEGYDLAVGAKIVFRRVTATGFELQAAQKKELKAALGRLVWWLLFGVGQRPEFEAELENKVLPKVKLLRSRALATAFFDAGSSCHAAAEAYMGLPRLPIAVPGTPPDWAAQAEPRQHRASLVSLRIVTNSLPVMQLCSNNKRQEGLPEPVLVGGQYRQWSASVGGLLSEACLREWNLRFDLAVMGTAGYRPGPEGGFGSRVADEVQSKLSFMSRSAFRIVLCHSEKLTREANPFTVFAPLDPVTVDLIVTDDGVESGCADDVNAFRDEATRAGVSTVVLKHAERATGSA